MIRAEHYNEAVAKLMADPIIIKMEASLPEGVNLDSYELMIRALRAYQDLGGTVESHIGGPIEAIKAIRESR